MSRINEIRMGDVDDLNLLIEAIKTELGGKIVCKKLEEKDKKIVNLEIKVTLLEEKVAYNAICYNLLERRWMTAISILVVPVYD